MPGIQIVSPKVIRQIISLTLIAATLVWAFNLAFLPRARATVTPTVTSLITQAATVKASSAAKAAIKLAFSVDAGEQLAALTVVATDSAATSFNPATDLAALDATTEANSGIALYDDAGATAGSFDATDAVVPMATESAWSSGSSTLTLTSPAAAGTYFLVYKTAAAAVDGHGFVLTIPATGIATTLNSPTITPVSTAIVTIDTVAPTVNVNTTGPANNATGVPISAFIHMGFSENIDLSTINPTNITFCSVSACPGGTPVASGIRSFPNGFDIVVSAPPTFAASSRFAKVGSTSTAFFNIMGSSAIVPQPPTGYASPTVGDIVITQRETFPPEVGLITDATLTSGTFAVNGFPAFGGMQITKFATPAATGLVTAATALTAGDIVVVNTTGNPTDVRYNWHIVTTGAAVNHANLRLDGSAGGAPQYVSGSRFSKITPSATEVDNGATPAGLLAVSVGDMVFIKVGSTYGWHLVTSAGDLSSDATENTAFIDGGASDPAIAASSQMSKLTPGAEGAVSASTTLDMGDIVMAHTTANASNGGAYAFHMVSGGAAVNNTALRFDNFPGSLNPSTTYVATTTTAVTDAAGNPLASNQTLTFTTGSTGGTNTTPPFVQSSQPQSGSQTHPIGAPIRLTFSVDMASSGGGSITDDANIGLFTDNFGAPGTPVTTAKAYDSASKTVTLTPSAPLTASTGYVVRVNISATSVTGTALNSPSTQPYFLSFRTASGLADSAPPTVLGVDPATTSTGVSLGKVITAGFSEDMDPSTISTTTVTLKKTSNSAAVTGNVTYNPQSRSVNFAPSTALESSLGGGSNGQYTFTIVGGASDPRVKDLSGNALAANFTSTFTTTATADNTKPFVTFGNADNFSVAVGFNEAMKSGGGPNAVDNISNYTLTTGASDAPSLTSVGLGGKTVTYDAGTRTARITGLSLVNGNRYQITVAVNAQDLSSNAMDDTAGTPAKNVFLGLVQDSTATGGQIGPGSGTIDPGMQGMNPTRVTPMSRAAGVTSNYKVEFLAGTSIPSGGQIVLTFPAGFTLGAANKVDTTLSFCNADLNGPADNAPGIASVAGSSDAGTITITTNTAATGTNSFLCVDLLGITNSTVPSSSGYTVTIQTKDASGVALQTLTAAPFYLGTAGSGTLQVQVFKDANSNSTDDGSEGVNSATVYLFSPASGGQEATTASGTASDSSATRDGIATFSNLSAGDYMVGIKPNATIDVAFNSAPQPITIAGSGTTLKKFALSSAAAITISGTVTGSNGTKVDVFASSPNGFTKKTLTLNGATAYSLPVSPNSTYNVGVGPAMPESFFTPGAPPPPPPDFTFMPPPNVQVQVAGVSVSNSTVAGLAFSLSLADKTITGTVVDSAGTGVSGAGVFCRPVSNSTLGGSSVGFGTGGQTNTSGAFTLKTVEGVYLCGVFKPGMPPVPEKQITVGASSNTPATLSGSNGFVLDANTSSLTITGTIKDDSGNAIPYAGVSGRRVVSTSDTTALGGDSSNFVGGPTDANGAYTLYVSSSSTWVVEAFAPGFGRLGTKTISVGTSNSTGQDFSAQNTTFRTITGTATTGGSNTPVQGVMVRAENSTGSSGNMTASAADGTYTIKVPDGTYNVSCFFPGVGDSAAVGGAITLSSITTTAVRNCTAGTLITVTVQLTDGTNPITGAGVDVRDSNGRGNSTNVSTTSGANAVYTVKVPPGTYTVRAGHPAYGKLGETTSVDADTTITYSTASTSGAVFAVTGTVTGDGSPLSGAWVSLIGTPTGTTNKVFMGGQTIANGTFSISVPAGSYRLRVDKPGYKSPAESTVTVTAPTAAGTVALTTAGRTITGTISIASTGAVSNAFVDATDGAGGYAVAQTNASGVYSLAVDNGTWTLRVHAPGYEGGPLPVTVLNNSPSGQNIALTAITGFTQKAEKPETMLPTQGGLITNPDIGDKFKANFTANALGTGSNAATVTTKTNTAMPNPPSGAVLAKNGVSISAVGSDGAKISSLNDCVNIVMPYDEANLPSGASEANLVIGTWNEATQTWDTLSTVVDTTLNTLTGCSPHLSDFAPLVPSGESAPSAPTNFSVSNPRTGTSLTLSWTASSGAATYNVYKSTDNSSFPLLASTASTSYTASSLTANTAYYFKVSAVSATSAESAATAAVSGTPTVAGGGGGGTTTTTAPSTTSGSVTATPTAGGTTTYTPSDAASPTVGVSLPANAVSASTTVAVDSTTLSAAGISVAPQAAGVTSVIGTPFNLTATAGTSAVATFNQPVTLTFTYTDSQIPAGAKESDLTVMFYNTTTANWEALTTTLDATNNKVTATTMHFTVFILAVKPVAAPPATPALTASTGAHANGTLVLDNGTVYLIKDGKRVGFRNPDEYKSHGYNFGQLVAANAQDKALPQAEFVQKALEGTLVLDSSDNRTVYMIGTGASKRGFTSSTVFTKLGYKFGGLLKINLSDYPSGPAISSSTEAHPDGALVKDGATIWWIRSGQKVGFETMAVFNTYGFSLSKVVTANASDKVLAEGAIVKFRDGTLVNDGSTYYLISDGKKLSFSSAADLTAKGYKTSNAITTSLSAYTSGGSVQ